MPELPKSRINDLLGAYGSIKQIAGVPTPAQTASMIWATSTVAGQVGTKKGYRPPEWGQLYNSTDLSSENSNVVFMSYTSGNGKDQMYFFDAVLSTDHNTQRQITEHPVQWRAAITDHSFQKPASVTLEIGMSDVMDNPVSDSAVSSIVAYSNAGKGKSVNAYQHFVALQESGYLITLNTRLRRYSNMLIESISSRDDHKTVHGLKCIISLREVFIARTGKASKSLYPAETMPESEASVNTSKENSLPLASVIHGMRYGTVIK